MFRNRRLTIVTPSLCALVVLSSPAPTPADGSSEPGRGIAVRGECNLPPDLLVGSRETNEVLRYDGATGAFIGVVASGGGLDSVSGLVLTPGGHLLVSSGLSHEVLRYDAYTGEFVDTFASDDGLSVPHGLAQGADGNLYVSSRDSDQILRFDGLTGAFIDDFVSAGSGDLDSPHGLLFGPDGNLYVSSRGNHSVKRYDGANGDFMDTFVPSGSGGLDWPRGLEFGPEGDLYVCSWTSDEVLRYDGQTGAFIQAAASGGGLNGPNDVLFDSEGHLLVSSQYSDQVLLFDRETGEFIDVFASGGGLDVPNYMIFRYMDCNANGVLDTCDIESGASSDCNANEIPDECIKFEEDCNSNALPDECDIAGGTSQDDDTDGIPDECELVIFVDADATGAEDGSSWTDAYIDLQDALGHAVGGNIWVAEGTYTPAPPGGDRTATFQLLTGVGIYGGFSGDEMSLEQRNFAMHVTILSGDLNGDDGEDFANNDENSYHVVTASDTAYTAVLDGFTITGGNADAGSPDTVGSAIFNDGGHVTVRNCAIVHNTGYAAVENRGTGRLEMGNCLFLFNGHEGEGLRNTGIGSPELILTDCVFQDHVYSGIDIGAGTTVCLSDCTFINNGHGSDYGPVYGGGVDNRADNVTLTNCTFIGNRAVEYGGGISNEGENLVLIGCHFTGNSPAGVWTNQDTTTFINCTMKDNSGVGIYSYTGDLFISNSILWGNSDGSEQGQIYLDWEWDEILAIDHSIVQSWTGQWGGTNNSGDDPLFADGDGRLSADSPAVDTGDNQSVPEDLMTDLDGHVRIVDADGFGGAVVDRGAYEVPCPGDANGDGLIDPLDAGFVLARLLCEVGAGDAGCDIADQNGNGVVDPLDVGWVLARFGECP